MGLNPGGKRESPVLLAGACSERANHIALDTRVAKCKIEEPQNIIVYEHYCVLCRARKIAPKLCLAVTKRGKKPDRSDVGKLLPNKCND